MLYIDLTARIVYEQQQPQSIVSAQLTYYGQWNTEAQRTK